MHVEFFLFLYIIVAQIKKCCTEQEQVIATLQNDVASSDNKQSQLIKSVEQLQDELLVSKNQFLDCSNRNITLEVTIVELTKEKQCMMEELCQVRVRCLLLCIQPYLLKQAKNIFCSLNTIKCQMIIVVTMRILEISTGHT